MQLLATGASPLQAPSLLARLLVMGVLLELAQNAALLQLHVEALEGAIDRLIGLDGYVNQIRYDSYEEGIMTQETRRFSNAAK